MLYVGFNKFCSASLEKYTNRITEVFEILKRSNQKLEKPGGKRDFPRVLNEQKESVVTKNKDL